MSGHPVSETASGVVTIAVWVVPRSSRSVIDGRFGEHLKVRVVSPPEDGRANAEVAGVLGDALGAEVRLKTGMRGRSKVFEVTGSDVVTVRRKLGI